MREDQLTDLFFADMQDFYLHTPLDKPVYIRIHTRPTTLIALKACDHEKYIVYDEIWFQVNKAMFDHPSAGCLSKDRLDRHMATKAYNESSLVPCLYSQEINKTKFTFVVYDFLDKTKSKAAN